MVRLGKLEIYDCDEDKEKEKSKFTQFIIVSLLTILFMVALFCVIYFALELTNKSHIVTSSRVCVYPESYVGYKSTHITKEMCWVAGGRYVFEKHSCTRQGIGWTIHEIESCVMHDEEPSSQRCIDKYNSCLEISDGNMNIVWGE